jgi:hypothetical protein
MERMSKEETSELINSCGNRILDRVNECLKEMTGEGVSAKDAYFAAHVSCLRMVLLLCAYGGLSYEDFSSDVKDYADSVEVEYRGLLEELKKRKSDAKPE